MLNKTGQAMQQEPVRPRALLSVWDKRDIVPFAQGLADLGLNSCPPAAQRGPCVKRD